MISLTEFWQFKAKHVAMTVPTDLLALFCIINMSKQSHFCPNKKIFQAFKKNFLFAEVKMKANFKFCNLDLHNHKPTRT